MTRDELYQDIRLVTVHQKNRENKWPEPNNTILAIIQGFRTKRKLYVVLNVVDEDDCSFRTVDDNSELSHSFNVIKWAYLPKLDRGGK